MAVHWLIRLYVSVMCFTFMKGETSEIKIMAGFKVYESDALRMQDKDGVIIVMADTHVKLWLFGNFSQNYMIRLSDHISCCDNPVLYDDIPVHNVLGRTANVELKIPNIGIDLIVGEKVFYFCVKLPNGTLLHQGSEKWLQLKVHKDTFPLWAMIAVVVLSVFMSSLLTGLHIGLLALDITELRVYAKSGTRKEQSYANAILPLRESGNVLLCSLLFGCTLINSFFTIIIDYYLTGWVTLIVATTIIVIFCEILPCAICARYGLLIGAKTLFVTKVNLFVTGFLAYPLGKLLDVILGKEITNYSKDRLEELVKLSSGLGKEEMKIISGALGLDTKKVEDVMTVIADVYMLPITAVLDFNTVTEIMKSGFSRIPIYDGTRENIVSLLFTKDLAMIDPDDQIPLRLLTNLFKFNANFINVGTTLNVVLKVFKDGVKGHMAFVRKMRIDSNGAQVFEIIGLVTLEDVIEEVIQAEIQDETDVYMDNRSKQKRKNKRLYSRYISVFSDNSESKSVYASPQLQQATFQYLSTEVPPFREELVSRSVLSRLLTFGVSQNITMKEKSSRHQVIEDIIYEYGVPADCFVLVLEGRVQVILGSEGQQFEGGPFTDFGRTLLEGQEDTFKPDYTVRAFGEVRYIRITRDVYLAAVRATKVERGEMQFDPANEPYPFLFNVSSLLNPDEET